MRITKYLILCVFFALLYAQSSHGAISRFATVSANAQAPAENESASSFTGMGVSASASASVGGATAFFGVGSVASAATAVGDFWQLKGSASASAVSAAGGANSNSFASFSDEITITSPVFDGQVGSILVDLRYHAIVHEQDNGFANGRFEFRIESAFGAADANFDLVESGETFAATSQPLLFIFGQKLFVRGELQTRAGITGVPVPFTSQNGIVSTFFRHDGSASIDASNTAEVLGFTIADEHGNVLDESQFSFSSGSGTSPSPVPIPPALALLLSGLFVIGRRTKGQTT